MAEEVRKTVKIACSQVNGLTIFLHQNKYDDGTGSGYHPVLRDGPGVKLNGPSARHAGSNAPAEGLPAITEVDADWWGKWMAQNKGKNALFDLGVISEVKPDPGEPTPNPTTRPTSSRPQPAAATETPKES